MICQYCGKETEPEYRWHEKGDCELHALARHLSADTSEEMDASYVQLAGIEGKECRSENWMG